MKNPTQEKFRRLARQAYASNTHWWRGTANDEIDRHAPPLLTWWGSLCFPHGRRLVNLQWEHLRQAYKDAATQLALKNTERFKPDVDDWLALATPRYSTVGRSRKRLDGHSLPPSALGDRWIEAYTSELRRLLSESDVVVVPSFRAKASPHGLFINLVIPQEVRSPSDIASLIGLARALLAGETDIQDAFPGVRFDSRDWEAEADKRGPRDA